MLKEPRTTVALHHHTKAKLDTHRAPGQCYDGFICQLVDLWEKTKRKELTSIAGTTMETRELGSDKVKGLNV
jgi:hypothetical protein